MKIINGGRVKDSESQRSIGMELEPESIPHDSLMEHKWLRHLFTGMTLK